MSTKLDSLPDDLADLLPDTIRLLVELIGLSATLSLVERHGGTAIWVPKHAKPDHVLAKLIGGEALTQLCAYAGDTPLEIARCTAVLKAVRNRRIIAASQTQTNRQLARQYQTTERHIRRIRAGCGGENTSLNLDLFNDFLTLENKS